MTDIPQKPSEPSYTEMAQRAREARKRPPGLFWGLVGALMTVGVLMVAYGLILVAPLVRIIPRWMIFRK